MEVTNSFPSWYEEERRRNCKMIRDLDERIREINIKLINIIEEVKNGNNK